MPCSLPPWIGTGACWLRMIARPRAGSLPCPYSSHTVFPVRQTDSASTTSLSRPAQASQTLRPARLLTHRSLSDSVIGSCLSLCRHRRAILKSHSWALSRGSILRADHGSLYSCGCSTKSALHVLLCSDPIPPQPGAARCRCASSLFNLTSR